VPAERPATPARPHPPYPVALRSQALTVATMVVRDPGIVSASARASASVLSCLRTR